MVKFTQEANVAATSRKKVLKIVRDSARHIGMVAENIKAKKKGAARVKVNRYGKLQLHLEVRRKGRNENGCIVKKSLSSNG